MANGHICEQRRSRVWLFCVSRSRCDRMKTNRRGEILMAIALPIVGVSAVILTAQATQNMTVVPLNTLTALVGFLVLFASVIGTYWKQANRTDTLYHRFDAAEESRKSNAATLRKIEDTVAEIKGIIGINGHGGGIKEDVAEVRGQIKEIHADGSDYSRHRADGHAAVLETLVDHTELTAAKRLKVDALLKKPVKKT